MWQRGPNGWALTPQKCIKNWTEEDKAFLASYFQKKCMREGSIAYGAFCKEKLVAFSLLETRPLGEQYAYFNLLGLFVTRNVRGQGLGTQLFQKACIEARKLGAKRLFLCVNPAEDTVAFYRKMGCTEAKLLIENLMQEEPDAYYMEAEL